MTRQPKFFISPFLILFFSCLQAQSDTIPVSAVIHANNIRATVWSNGLLFSDGAAGAFFTDYTEQAPNISAIQAAGLWLSLTDPAGVLSSDIPRRHDGKSGFMPGRIDPLFGEHRDFNRIWKVTKAEIVAHIQDYQDNHVIDNPIPAIFGWPGRKNSFFEQYNNGFALPEAEDFIELAPFNFQALGDGSIYEPDQGDYPFPLRALSELGIPSEILWFSFHTIAEGPENDHHLFEIHCTIYAYQCGESEILSNTIFLNYCLINRTTEDYCVNMGMWVDAALGCPEDDYIGSDPETNMAYVYNSDNLDEACGDFNGYGESPPALGVRWIEWPEDASFGDCGVYGDSSHTIMAIYESENALPGTIFPTSDAEVSRYSSGIWRDGSPLVSGENGYQTTNIPATHIFPGDVYDSDTWTEISAGQTPGKRSIVSGVGSVGVEALGTHFYNSIAFTYARGPGLNNLENIKILQDSMAYFTTLYIKQGADYPVCTGMVSVPTEEIASEQNPALRIFPNPATGVVRAEVKGNRILNLTLTDTAGKMVLQTAGEVSDFSVANLAPGLYLLNATIENGSIQVGKIVVAK